MKKKYFLLFFLCLALLPLHAQKRNKKDKKDKNYKWQLTINATDLLGRATGVKPVISVLTSPYDFQLAFSPKKRWNFRLGLGYQFPEQEAPSGAVEEANKIDHTFHFRFGISKNKFFFDDKWVWTLGGDIIYSRRVEKEFSKDDISFHAITNERGIGASTILQYYLTPRFSLGVEMAVYASVSIRERLIPVVIPFDPLSSFVPEERFFNNNPRGHGRLYAPIELYVFYKF